MKRIKLLIIFTFLSVTSFSQNAEKVFFDSEGNVCSQAVAYFYRVLDKSPDYYKAYYVSNNKLYFEGIITNPSSTKELNNRYSGKCIWYYNNEKIKRESHYNDKGILDGETKHYHENGKIWKTMIYKDGNLENNKYFEYSVEGETMSVFEELFESNSMGWDVYDSELSSASINSGKLSMTSKTKKGTSRFISCEINSSDYIIETVLNLSNTKENRAGIIWGYKNWENYSYFILNNEYVYLGSYYEGVHIPKIEGLFSGEVNKKGDNSIKLFNTNNRLVISINGSIVIRTSSLKMYGMRLGFVTSGISELSSTRLVIKEVVGQNNTALTGSDLKVKSTGSGIIVSTKGHIITNFHVIEGNNLITVDLTKNGEVKTYNATVIYKDEQNDLAIIKIKEEDFGIDKINYSFNEASTLNVGSYVFSIGYPLALSGMGKEAKFVDGKISSRTGYNNAINSFQTSIPVQPGNSGGPVFDEKGNLIGIINAKVNQADNVSYAIKLNYVMSLYNLIDEPTPSQKTIETLSLEEKIKELSKYVVLIKIK